MFGYGNFRVVVFVFEIVVVDFRFDGNGEGYVVEWIISEGLIFIY